MTSATTGAGGGAISLGGDPTIENCLFIGNIASRRGGAVYVDGSFGFGQPPNPGYSTIARLLNCTFVDNSAPEGGAFSYGEVLMAMVNCVEWDNGPDAWASVPGGPGLVNINVSHSIVSPDVPESFTDDYEGNVRVDPQFVAPELGNYRLRPESPAVDGGTAAETIVPNNVPDFGVDAPSDDIEGTTRPIGEAHDMGAYEFDPEAFVDPLDPSGDGMTNAVDVQLVINGALGNPCDTCDTNRDGSVDAVDVQFIINAVLGTV